MKKTHIAAAAVSLAALIAGGAIAQSASQSTQPPARHVRGDTDADGRVSQAEFVQARVTRLTALDVNRDGTVTPEEKRAAMQARHAERASQRFDRLDANKDGSISRAEFNAPREGRADRAARGPGHRGGHQRMGRGPEGGRGGAERVARGPVVIAEAQTRATEAFTRLDADRDGYLTRAERRAGMREHRQERRAERTARREQRQASPSAPASE